MRTHQSWIQNINHVSNAEPSEQLQATDFKEKHSILYCHECIECGVFFKSLKTLTRHKLDRHGLRPVFKCVADECARQIETVEEFLEHAQVHCQKNIACLKCSIKFNSKNSLRHHMKVSHYRPTMNTPSTATTTTTTTARAGSSSAKASRALANRASAQNVNSLSTITTIAATSSTGRARAQAGQPRRANTSKKAKTTPASLTSSTSLVGSFNQGT